MSVPCGSVIICAMMSKTVLWMQKPQPHWCIKCCLRMQGSAMIARQYGCFHAEGTAMTHHAPTDARYSASCCRRPIRGASKRCSRRLAPDGCGGTPIVQRCNAQPAAGQSIGPAGARCGIRVECCKCATGAHGKKAGRGGCPFLELSLTVGHT